MKNDFMDWDKFCRFLEEACAHYEKSAPVVSDYADDVYRQITSSSPTRVVDAREIHWIARLWDDGEWMQPNLAANGHYHLLVRLGRSTVGLGF